MIATHKRINQLQLDVQEFNWRIRLNRIVVYQAVKSSFYVFQIALFLRLSYTYILQYRTRQIECQRHQGSSGKAF